MKAYVYNFYGNPEKVLRLKLAEKPVPKENEVLIRVMYTAINDYDWALIKGKPLLYRLMFGLLKPKNPIPGMELSGIIEDIGSAVSEFMVGDAVYGDISEYGFGTFAEYLCINQKAILKKPKDIPHIEASALPHASLLALQALEAAGLKDKQKILINGAGGGVGTLAVQLCKMKNCEVTGVDTNGKLDKMLALGFDHVIDYKKEDFTKNDILYDIVLDCKTNKSAFAYLRSLVPKGNYITVGGNVGKLFSIAFWGKLSTLFSSKKLQVLALKPNKGLKQIGDLFVQGKLKCQIDGPYAFDELPRLVQYFGEAKHTGKIVVKVSDAKG